jgi:hypothetical protein
VAPAGVPDSQQRACAQIPQQVAKNGVAQNYKYSSMTADDSEREDLPPGAELTAAESTLL